ncbi:MAG TPA: hypothetical protein VKT32_06540, partial [Chthonomonadaceae bacterium]|nr:hypothetical protein [Chthonomonadaceae bacterium]
YAEWAYTGMVRRGGRLLALLENTRSKEGQYVVTGDSFQDAQVENITEQTVTLRSGKKQYALPKSEAVSVIALDKNAPYLAGGSGGPPAPDAPPPAPGTPVDNAKVAKAAADAAQAQVQPDTPADGDTNSDSSNNATP